MSKNRIYIKKEKCKRKTFDDRPYVNRRNHNVQKQTLKNGQTYATPRFRKDRLKQNKQRKGYHSFCTRSKTFSTNAKLAAEETMAISLKASSTHSVPQEKSFSFDSPSYIKISVELDLLPILMKRGKKEHGMVKDLSKSRIDEILANTKQKGMSILQATSLRRHHIKNVSCPNSNMSQMGLGEGYQIAEAAKIYEDAVASHLRKSGVQYISEKTQKRNYFRKFNTYKNLLTPDFLFQRPIELTYFCQLQKQTICKTANWLEAKMFYGASTIAPDGKSAVGNILPKSKRYVERFGNGVIMFSYGCGDKLAKELLDIGVLALDASSIIDLSMVESQQKTWCATKDGKILP